jgi:hypothetical protein
MGMWSDWYSKNAGKENALTSVDFVLKAIDKFIDKIYPVGSIYMSVNNTNPGIYLTGTTWSAWGNGRVPVGVDTNQAEFNSVEKTGGEKTHILSTAELPRISGNANLGGVYLIPGNNVSGVFQGTYRYNNGKYETVHIKDGVDSVYLNFNVGENNPALDNS